MLEELGIQEQAKGRYIHMAKKLGYFFVTTIGCYLTVLISAVYQWITRQYFPAGGSIAAAMSALLLSSIVNPTLFFYLNVDMREKFWEKFGAPIYRLLGITSTEPLRLSLNSRSSSVSLRKLGLRRPSIVPCQSNANGLPSSKSINVDSCSSALSGKGLPLADFVYWLSHEKLAPVIKEHARKEYAMENFLFYEDAMTYRSKGAAFVKTVTKLALQSKENSIKRVYASTELQQDWKELEMIANRIYTLYIKVCSLM
jgi:hypothetical protein